MAKADYRLCDVCESKAFYDANLNYELPSKETDWAPVDAMRWAVKPVERGDPALGDVGDWAVICKDCAKEYKTQIVRVEASEVGDD